MYPQVCGDCHKCACGAKTVIKKAARGSSPNPSTPTPVSSGKGAKNSTPVKPTDWLEQKIAQATSTDSPAQRRSVAAEKGVYACYRTTLVL